MMREVVKKLLKSCAAGRMVYEPIHKLYRLYSVPHRRHLLRHNGREVLLHLNEVAKRHKMPIFAAYGTLLGFVREKGFLAHDDDIDLGVLPGEWTPKRVLTLLLNEEKGFEFNCAFAYEGRITEFKLTCNNVPIDFFFYEVENGRFYAGSYHYFPEREYPDPAANTAQRVGEPRIEGLTTIPVFGMEFPAPEKYEAVLEALYGNWRIPDKRWDDSKHKCIEDLPGFAYRLTDINEVMAIC